MSDASTADLAGLWIQANVALFVVIVISIVLLLVALFTVLVYCCCCRRKSRHGPGGKLAVDHQLQAENGGTRGSDDVDADFTVTTTVRSQDGVVEIPVQEEQELKEPQLPYPDNDYDARFEAVSAPVIVISHEAVDVEEVRIQADLREPELHLKSQPAIDVSAQAGFPGLPPLPQEVEVTAEAELRLRSRPPPEVQAEVDARPTRLPRTEVVLRTESPALQVEERRQQRPLQAAASTFQPVVLVASTSSLHRSHSPSHEHRHGSTIYQSDDNEITIVDSDFSDYEDSPQDEVRKSAMKKSLAAPAPTFGVGVGIEVTDFGWQTLSNQTVVSIDPVEDEEPIRAVDRHGEEYVPAPSPSLEAQQMQREENLAELDKTLEVFEVQADVGVSVEIGGSQEEVRPEGYVDEEEILPLDRSQVPH